MLRALLRTWPRVLPVLFGNKGYVEWVCAARGAQNGLFNRVSRRGLDRGQIGPLIRVGPEVFVDKNAVTLLAWRRLQGERDQVAEAALGCRILIGKEPVIGR